MSTRRFAASTRMRTSAQAAFDWIADYRNVPLVLEGVTKWQPLGRKTKGTGARFDVEMRTLGVPLDNELELVEWEPPRRIAWSSRAGLIRQDGAWTIEDKAGGIEVTLSIQYEPPAAALGNLLAGPVEALARKRLQRALERMAGYVETAG